MKDKYKGYEEAIDFLIEAIRIARPKTTKKEGKNVIANLGNYIQLKRYEND